MLDDFVDHPANHRLLPAELARREMHAAVALPRALPGVPLYLHEVMCACVGGWMMWAWEDGVGRGGWGGGRGVNVVGWMGGCVFAEQKL